MDSLSAGFGSLCKTFLVGRNSEKSEQGSPGYRQSSGGDFTLCVRGLDPARLVWGDAHPWICALRAEGNQQQLGTEPRNPQAGMGLIPEE